MARGHTRLRSSSATARIFVTVNLVELEGLIGKASALPYSATCIVVAVYLVQIAVAMLQSSFYAQGATVVGQCDRAELSDARMCTLFDKDAAAPSQVVFQVYPQQVGHQWEQCIRVEQLQDR